MLTAFDARLRYLRELIRDYAAKAPPTLQAQADANADIELHDLDERLMGCETNDEADALVRAWVRVWA